MVLGGRTKTFQGIDRMDGGSQTSRHKSLGNNAAAVAMCRALVALEWLGGSKRYKRTGYRCNLALVPS